MALSVSFLDAADDGPLFPWGVFGGNQDAAGRVTRMR